MSSKHLQSIRGMHDVLPQESFQWQWLERELLEWITRYSYKEIRTPVMESTELFKRSIGDVTDIVEKEMYTFEDRNGDSLSLRPEGTASLVRAGIQHGLFYNQVQRLWYKGNMYRHERPQKGRYREFSQFGVEAYGMPDADIEAEQLIMTHDLWQRLGIQASLELNTLGLSEERAAYRSELVAYYENHLDCLDEDARNRLYSNPLRILDSKHPQVKSLNEGAPVLSNYLSDASVQHFERLKAILDSESVTYTVNPKLVRGLDYYCHTVFEWITNELGAQGTICAGGRYDGLISQLGGKPTPAVGFAIGIERILALLEHQTPWGTEPLSIVAVLYSDDAAQLDAFKAARRLRGEGLDVYMHCGSASLKSQLKKTSKTNIPFALIFNSENEAKEKANDWNLKDLTLGTQQCLPADEVIKRLKQEKN